LIVPRASEYVEKAKGENMATIPTKWRVYVAAFLILYLAGFSYYYLTTSTIASVRIIIGAAMGGAFALIGFCGYLLLSLGLLRVFPLAAQKRMSIVLVVVLSSVWLVGGILASRPGSMFRDLICDPAPKSLEILDTAGVDFSIDGALWVFTCRISPSDLQALIEKHHYARIDDTKGAEYWMKRLNVRAQAEWRVGTNYLIYLQRTNRIERRIFAAENGEIVQFVFCTFSHGL
jgi:hypothetical protein